MIKRIIYVLAIIVAINVHGQEYQDTPTLLHIDTLYKRFEKNYIKSDSIETLRYANAYFKKALKTKDSNLIARGYYLRIISPKSVVRNDLYDSIIALKNGLKKNDLITIAHHDLGAYYYNNSDYSNALIKYLKAKKTNNGTNKKYFDFKLDIEIASLKLRIEENQEALKLLQKVWKKFKKNNYDKKYSNEYISIIFNLANAHRKLHHIDSAKSYIKLGLQKSNKNYNIYYYNFQILKGVIELNNSYNLDIFSSIKESIYFLNSHNEKTLIDQRINTSFAYYYIGKAHYENNQYDKAIHSFLKVDSIIGNSVTILPETLQTYTYLKEYYKDIGDTESQLKYLQKLVRFKDNLDSQYKFINNEIKNKYDFPRLIEEEKQIIAQFEKKNKKTTLIIKILMLTGSVIFAFFLYQWIQKNKYRKRFKKLQEQISSKEKLKKEFNTIEKPNLPEEVFIKVITRLEEFEQKKQYLDRSINLSKIAQSTHTNHSYFFKAFKYLKKESFNSYLRDLRLMYAIERLREDRVFRKYTIKTIAYESGFSNAESFSKYFYKMHKIYPSFFIKQLEKEKK